MAQANAIYMEVFEKFYPKLAEALPALFDNLVTNLRCKNLLPTYHEDNLNSLETNEGKSEYFLNNVIKSGLQIKYLIQFKEMLKVMRSSGDYAINCLVDDIENFIGTETDGETIHSAMPNLNINEPSVPTHLIKGKLLGSGAFGKVYICHDQDSNHQLAVKEIEIDPSIPPEDVKSLEKEIDLLKNLKHERIVLYYGTTRTDRNICIFMEYMSGGSVYSRVRNDGAFTEMLTKKYTRQILEGTNYLHSQKIIHRDIKGANVLIDAKEDVKIADFGASKRLKTIHQSRGFSKNTFVGTAHWMAPEVIDEETFGTVGPKADIWSIGCTVIEMLTSKPPFDNLEPNAAIFAIAIKPVSYDLPPSCSEHVHSFLKMCLTKDIEARSTASELLQHAFVNQSA